MIYTFLIGMCYRNFGLYINVGLFLLGMGLFALFMLSIYKNYEKLNKLTVIVLYIAVLVIGVMAIITKSGILEQLDSAEAIVNFIKDQSGGTNIKLWFVLIQFLQVTFVPIPSSIVTGAGAIIFPTRLEAILLSCIGLLIGSVVAFLIGRIFGISAVKWIIGEDTLTKYYEMINGKDKLLLFYMFILPVFPDDMLCMIAGLTSMSFPTFLIMQVVSRPLNVALTVYTVEIFKIIPFEGWYIAIWVVIGLAILALMILFSKCAPALEKNLIKFINNLSKRNIITYKKTNVEEYKQKNYALESRVYKSDPYDANSILKKEVRAILAQPQKYYDKAQDILDDDIEIKSNY